MKTILLILLPIIISAQTFEAASSLHSFASAYTAYHFSQDRELKAKGDLKYLKHNKTWHRLQNVELALSFGLGALGLYENIDDEKIDWIGIAQDAFVFMSIRWTIRDGVYNTLSGNSFFHQSDTTTALIEPYGSPYLKIGLFIAALLIKYVFF